MEPGWNSDGIGRNYTYSTPSQLSVDCRSVHLILVIRPVQTGLLRSAEVYFLFVSFSTPTPNKLHLPNKEGVYRGSVSGFLWKILCFFLAFCRFFTVFPHSVTFLCLLV